MTKISIITPCFNSEKYLRYTIDSVISQTYSDWELILINDKSQDGTLKIIKDYMEHDERIRLVDLKENGGIANARNSGIEISTGEYIAFLDSDDLWDANKLEAQLHFMKSNGAYLSHCAYRKINSDGIIINKAIPVSQKIGYNKMLKHNEIGCLTAMYNSQTLGKRYFKDIGHEDYVYWLDLLKGSLHSYGLETVLASYRVHRNTTSSNKIRAARFTWNIYRNVEGFSFYKSIYYFINYSFRALKKYLN